MVRLRVVVLALVLFGCTTYRDQLARGQHAFEGNDHDRTLAVLRDLEPDVGRLEPQDQASYAYLRGMTDYQVGYQRDARHWLSLARALEDASPGLLPADWKVRTTAALTELDAIVRTKGTSGLGTERRSGDEVRVPPAGPDAGPS